MLTTRHLPAPTEPDRLDVGEAVILVPGGVMRPVALLCFSTVNKGDNLRLMRIGEPGAERPALLSDDGRLLDLSGIGRDIDAAFIAGGGADEVRRFARGARLPVVGELNADGTVTVAGGARIGAPVAKPEKIICIGLNYSDHAEETGQAVPAEPIVFMKAPNCLVGPNDQILIPRQSRKTDWEIELAVVIGAQARYLGSPDDAGSVILGYAISNDVSEREFQLERGGQWDKGKCCETFNPMGPWVATRDEVPDVQALSLRLSVNGITRQNGTTRNMIFDVHHIIWYLSQFMVLEPGDIVNTGTPAGVSLGHDDVPFLAPGDLVELEADSLGRQASFVGEG
jgi:2-keto-4-pentenoate hydratase/2-oxohepta-3-ene-1,7-dioic acid hydratase in catechol pathway